MRYCFHLFISFHYFLLWSSVPESRSLLTPHSASRLTSGLYLFLRKILAGIAENFENALNRCLLARACGATAAREALKRKEPRIARMSRMTVEAALRDA